MPSSSTVEAGKVKLFCKAIAREDPISPTRPPPRKPRYRGRAPVARRPCLHAIHQRHPGQGVLFASCSTSYIGLICTASSTRLHYAPVFVGDRITQQTVPTFPTRKGGALWFVVSEPRVKSIGQLVAKATGITVVRNPDAAKKFREGINGRRSGNSQVKVVDPINADRPAAADISPTSSRFILPAARAITIRSMAILDFAKTVRSRTGLLAHTACCRWASWPPFTSYAPLDRPQARHALHSHTLHLGGRRDHAHSEVTGKASRTRNLSTSKVNCTNQTPGHSAMPRHLGVGVNLFSGESDGLSGTGKGGDRQTGSGTRHRPRDPRFALVRDGGPGGYATTSRARPMRPSPNRQSVRQGWWHCTAPSPGPTSANASSRPAVDAFATAHVVVTLRYTGTSGHPKMSDEAVYAILDGPSHRAGFVRAVCSPSAAHFSARPSMKERLQVKAHIVRRW